MKKETKIITKELSKVVLAGLGPIAILLLYVFFSGKHDEKIMREHGINTECVTVAYAKGKTGSRGPVEGFHNKCAYFINDSIHYCYIFTSQKPLPVGLKLKVRYLVHENGRVTIDFPNEYKTEYAEYGFNDYGY